MGIWLNELSWTAGGDVNLKHRRRIDGGGGDEVHEVLHFPPVVAKWSADV